MLNLELRIPPPFVTLGTAGLMWGIGRLLPYFYIEFGYKDIVTFLLLFIGIAFGLSGLFAFNKAGTTFNPTKPEKGTTLVTKGVYKLTRNPMYLGFFLILSGLVFYISNPLNIIILILFVLYLNRFQIRPEERFLLSKYGNQYSKYMNTVRRWI